METLSLEERLANIEAHKKIEFRTVDLVGKIKHTIQPRKISDDVYAGIRTYTPRQKEDMQRWEYVEPDDTFVLETGVSLDLTKPQDVVKWQWIKHYVNDVIALTKEEGNVKSRPFYIFVEEQEAAKTVTKGMLKAKALNLIIESTPDELRKRVKLYGVNMDNIKPETIRGYLIEAVEKDVEKVLNVYTNPVMVAKFTLLEAVEKGVVTEDKSTGLFYFGTQLLGNNMDKAVSFINDSANAKILKAITSQLNKEILKD